ncbi:EVE domain-containing protein [Methanococcus maripaludis]|uniref:Putative RNA-binding protein n=1 Tax=Methanococcus maripaludis TaxID=39152 RepID=A0A8T4CJ83_METMI|nr:EVE domain-containing protein [Methanococcus maripaludis]MBM7408417.1 putative RNA-binding protein [Methanococcus maripaludis]MBP2220087.1 putative RNA-binding protein [Methanococcus maripaludis]
MNYFLCITTEENWNVIKEKKIWGVSERYKNIISKVALGDYLIIYEMGKPKTKTSEAKPQYVRAVYEVVSEIKEDTKKIFEPHMNNTSEVYPLRVKLKEVKTFEKPVIFKKLVPEMEFIKNKKVWAGSLRRAMVQLGEGDYKKIIGN